MSRPSLLLTGATGAVGQPLLRALLNSGRFEQIHVIARDLSPLSATDGLHIHHGDLAYPNFNYNALPPVDVVIHAAASTQFRATPQALNAINFAGTERLLAWAENLPQSPRFIHLSTCCVAGMQTGLIREEPIPSRPIFVNAYELSKWQAEQRIATSPLAPEIVRLATVAGSELDGSIARPGALQTSLRWLRRGLLPLVPGEPHTRVDLISSDLVARFILKLCANPHSPHAIYHLSAGDTALTLEKFLQLAASRCALKDTAWARRQILPPVIASQQTFALFRDSIAASRDLLFNEVLASADSFLPVLLYPKRFSTERAEHAWGGPLPHPDSTAFLTRVIDAART